MMRDVAYQALPKQLRGPTCTSSPGRARRGVRGRARRGGRLPPRAGVPLPGASSGASGAVADRLGITRGRAPRERRPEGERARRPAHRRRAAAAAPRRCCRRPRPRAARAARARRGALRPGRARRGRHVLAGAVEDARRAGDRRVEMGADLRARLPEQLQRPRAGPRAAADARRAGDRAVRARSATRPGRRGRGRRSGSCTSAPATGRRRGGAQARAGARPGGGEHGLELRALSGSRTRSTSAPRRPTRRSRAVEAEILPRTRGFPVAEGAVLSVLGGLLSMQGRFDEARALHGRGREIFASLGPALPVAEGDAERGRHRAAGGRASGGRAAAARRVRALEAADETAIRTSVAASAGAGALRAGPRRRGARVHLGQRGRRPPTTTCRPRPRGGPSGPRSWRGGAIRRRRGWPREAVELARGTDDPNLTALALLAAGERGRGAGALRGEGEPGGGEPAGVTAAACTRARPCAPLAGRGGDAHVTPPALRSTTLHRDQATRARRSAYSGDSGSSRRRADHKPGCRRGPAAGEARRAPALERLRKALAAARLG